jgi:hypothetical protein
VLLRFHRKFGMWLTLDGHIERDELSNEAAGREARVKALSGDRTGR